MPNKVEKLISGGQTGADRAALDFAIENGFEYGGFVPRGRLAEDGPLSSKYVHLTEAISADGSERTRLNVLSSDGTILITHGPPAGGSKLTEQYAHSLSKPLLHIDLSNEDIGEAADKAREWLDLMDCQTLNIAGPRTSEDQEIYDGVKRFLNALFL